MARPRKNQEAEETEIQDFDPSQAPEENKFALKTFECWRAEPVFKYRIDENTGQQERYMSEVIRKGDKPISTTIIEQRQADELNSHVENSKLFYYEVK